MRRLYRSASMKTTISAQLGQQLHLTPQLLQSIRLLQLDGMQLELEIRRALETNPLLELEELADSSDDVATSDDGASDIAAFDELPERDVGRAKQQLERWRRRPHAARGRWRIHRPACAHPARTGAGPGRGRVGCRRVLVGADRRRRLSERSVGDPAAARRHSLGYDRAGSGSDPSAPAARRPGRPGRLRSARVSAGPAERPARPSAGTPSG